MSPVTTRPENLGDPHPPDSHSLITLQFPNRTLSPKSFHLASWNSEFIISKISPSIHLCSENSFTFLVKRKPLWSPKHSFLAVPSCDVCIFPYIPHTCVPGGAELSSLLLMAVPRIFLLPPPAFRTPTPLKAMLSWPSIRPNQPASLLVTDIYHNLDHSQSFTEYPSAGLMIFLSTTASSFFFKLLTFILSFKKYC